MVCIVSLCFSSFVSSSVLFSFCLYFRRLFALLCVRNCLHCFFVALFFCSPWFFLFDMSDISSQIDEAYDESAFVLDRFGRFINAPKLEEEFVSDCVTKHRNALLRAIMFCLVISIFFFLFDYMKWSQNHRRHIIPIIIIRSVNIFFGLVFVGFSSKFSSRFAAYYGTALILFMCAVSQITLGFIEENPLSMRLAC